MGQTLRFQNTAPSTTTLQATTGKDFGGGGRSPFQSLRVCERGTTIFLFCPTTAHPSLWRKSHLSSPVILLHKRPSLGGTASPRWPRQANAPTLKKRDHRWGVPKSGDLLQTSPPPRPPFPLGDRGWGGGSGGGMGRAGPGGATPRRHPSPTRARKGSPGAPPPGRAGYKGL